MGHNGHELSAIYLKDEMHKINHIRKAFRSFLFSLICDFILGIEVSLRLS